MSWLLEELELAAAEWDSQCEYTKPLIVAPYFAQRASVCANHEAHR